MFVQDASVVVNNVEHGDLLSPQLGGDHGCSPVQIGWSVGRGAIETQESEMLVARPPIVHVFGGSHSFLALVARAGE